MTVRVERLTEDRLHAAIPALARLRISVFRDWPYLYDGTIAYEQGYLAKFGDADGALVVAAYDGDEIIGAASASPMAGHAEDFSKPFRARGYDIGEIFYFGESVLLKPYRGRGLGHAFFDHREAHARSFGTYKYAAFCSVMRPEDHPQKPDDYRPLDPFWRKRGFEKLDGMIGTFAWKDTDQAAETAKPMQFWMKALA
jgi:GNAT superfamily N-acetyltransferase